MASKSLTATIFGVDKASPVFEQVGKSADRMSDDVAESGSKMGNAFSKGAKMAAGAIAAIGFADFVKDTVREASNLEQNIGAVQAVFADTSAIEKFGSTSAETVGIARQDYYQLAAVFGSQLKNMGVSADQLAPKTNQLVTLGADLAAVYGGTAADAVEAISSLLRGERDPIERYGVSIKQASIDAYEMANGLDTSTAAAKTHADMQATLALLFQQTSAAQGQFASQTDTLAESQQIANAKFKEAQAEIGQRLLPIVTDLTNFAADHLVPILGLVADGLGEVIDFVGDIPGPVKIALAAMLGFKLFQQTETFAKLASGVKGFREQMVLEQGLAKAQGVELSNWGAAASTAGKKLGGLGKMIGAGGLLAAGSFVIGEVSDAFADVARRQQQVEDTTKSLTDALVDNNGQWDQNIEKLRISAVEQSDAFKAFTAAGIDYKTVMDGLTGTNEQWLALAKKVTESGDFNAETSLLQAAALRDVKVQSEAAAKARLDYLNATTDETLAHVNATRALNDYNSATQGNTASAIASRVAQTALTGANRSASDALQDQADAADLAFNKSRRLATQTVETKDATVDLSGVMDHLARSNMPPMNKVLDDASAKSQQLSDTLGVLQAELDRLSGRDRTAEEATKDFYSAMDRARDSAKDADGNIVMLGRSTIDASGKINLASASGRDLYDTVSSMGDAARTAAADAATLAAKTGGTEAAAKAASSKISQLRNEFIKNAAQMGLTREQAKKLADQYFGIPSEVATTIVSKVDFSAADQALQTLADTTTYVNVRGKYVGTDNLPTFNFTAANNARAGGGAIEGSGPKGVDSVPIMGAPGEHVLTAGDVDAMGGQAGVYAFRRALHRGMRGMAGGGAVGSGPVLAGSIGVGSVTYQVNVHLPDGLMLGDARQVADRLAEVLPDAFAKAQRGGRTGRAVVLTG